MAVTKLKCARDLVARVSVVRDVYDKRRQWVESAFLPAVRMLRRSPHPTDRLRAAHGYYILGDVHDFNHAPEAAIRAYRICASLAPNQAAAAWREIGGMLDNLGQYKKAAAALRKALWIDPACPYAQSDLKVVEMELGNPTPPPYKQGDCIWASAELLASGQFQKALDAVHGKRTETARRQRARIFGAMRQAEQALREWEVIAHRRIPFEFESADFYFMPDELWNSPSIWSALWKARSHLKLWNASMYPDPPEGTTGNRRVELKLRYHIARTTRNRAKIRRLVEQYPKWTEAQELLRQRGT